MICRKGWRKAHWGGTRERLGENLLCRKKEGNNKRFNSKCTDKSWERGHVTVMILSECGEPESEFFEQGEGEILQKDISEHWNSWGGGWVEGSGT